MSFRLIHTTTNENARPFQRKRTHLKAVWRLKAIKIKDRFENALVWTAKTEAFEDASLDANVFGENGAVRKCISVDGT